MILWILIWDDSLLSDTLKCSVIEIIYSEAARTGKPVLCIVDDTIASKTKPSSQALHPIEDAYFHQSHLKGKPDYGHQAGKIPMNALNKSQAMVPKDSMVINNPVGSASVSWLSARWGESYR